MRAHPAAAARRRLTQASTFGTIAVLLLSAAAALAIEPPLGPRVALALIVAGSAIVLVAVLIASRRQLRRAQQQRAIAEQALDALPHALFVVDAARQGTPNIYVNVAYSALTGYAAPEAVSPDFDGLAIFDGDTRIGAPEDGAALKASVTVRRRDGTTVPATLELRNVAHESCRRLVGTLTRRAAAEPTAALGPAAQPEPSSSGTTVGNRPTDAFLSWLSHELRSPLNACVMWLDVLALAPQPDKLTKAVDAIKRSLARQARLVSELSDAAKVAAGGIELRDEPLDLVALIGGRIDSWQLLAMGKQVAFRPSIEVPAARIAGDRERLSQALTYLVENAIGSTPAGGRVELRVRAADAACIVEIFDTGAALSAEDTAHLAVPLWRAPTSTKARSGVGLGIAVAHHVAVKHGGSLTASSGASGTTFAMALPLAAHDADSHDTGNGTGQRQG